MARLQKPRAFPTFDPALHVQAAEYHTGTIIARITGVDIGVGSPCVALHALITENHRVSIFEEHFVTDMGFEAFIAEGHLGPTSTVNLVTGERAMIARSPLTARSPVEVLTEAGYRPLACKSSPHWRSRQINRMLQCGRGPGGLVMDPSCLLLIAALVGHRESLKGGGVMTSNTPRYQHAVDALGYLVEAAKRFHAAASHNGVGLAFDEVG